MQVVYQLPYKLAQYCKTFSLAKQSDYHYKTSSTFSSKTPSTSSFFTPPVAEQQSNLMINREDLLLQDFPSYQQRKIN